MTPALGGRRSRDKGKRGELEACEALKELVPGLQRSYHQARSGSDAPDIDSPDCPWWIEVKRCERINVHQAMEQALEASQSTPRRPPLIVHKRNRGEWLVTVRAQDLASIAYISKLVR